jgi:hypothetical protein
MLLHLVQKRQFYGILFTFIRSIYNYYQPLDVLSEVSCVEILYCTIYIFPNLFSWLTNLKSKIIHNFKIVRMMRIRCVMKAASTFKIYIYIYKIHFHMDKISKSSKISKINKISVWVSTCIVSCYALSWNFYIFLVSWVLDVVRRCVHGCNYYFYIFFVSWELDITCLHYIMTLAMYYLQCRVEFYWK